MSHHCPKALLTPCFLAVIFLGFTIYTSAQASPPPPQISATSFYSGTASASGAISLGTNFFVVGEDETDTLLVYRRHGGGTPVAKASLTAWGDLYVKGRGKKELDLEGAARLGDNVFWLGSHGNNKDGDSAPNRRQLFATSITETNGQWKFALAGRPYRHLMEDFAADPRLQKFKLGEGDAKRIAPTEAGGFNLEGLCATPEGHLLIGFRNPVPQGRALLVPVLNPETIVHGERARLGDPILLDLQGRGIRDLLLVDDEYFIIAGDYRGKKRPGALASQLYAWAGNSSTPRHLLDLPQLNPEVVIAYSDTGKAELQVLSDDGNNQLPPSGLRQFRSLQIDF